MPLLFSYGTLQLDSVQMDTFGRLLEGQHDILPGYELGQLEITDPAVLASSGKTYHPIARRCGGSIGIAGMVFEISDEELAHADRYEVSDYRRVLGELTSGQVAWVYVDARDAGEPAGSV
ncbi:MAG: gamma-glutamylcyclotransferase [Proteobacteria bacterium]|nr:gamma-glutamylcyclotransferase [Pseudomonadota bacterium]